MAAESTDSGGSQQVASAVPPGRRPIRLRWVALVVAVAVVATGVGVAALHREPATATVTATHPPAPLRVELREVSYHGITLSVPASWVVTNAACYRRAVAILVAVTAGGPDNCPHPPPTVAPTVSTAGTMVIVRPSDSLGLADIAIAKTPVTVAGRAALRGTGEIFGQPTTDLIMPDPGVWLQVMTPTAAEAYSIFASIAITPVDRNGCRDRVTSVAPSRNTAAATIVPAGANAGVVCEYLPAPAGQAHWLTGSAVLVPAQLAAIYAQLSGAVGTRTAMADDLGPFIWYQLVYPDGTRRTVSVALDAPGAQASDGRRTVPSVDPVKLPQPYLK